MNLGKVGGIFPGGGFKCAFQVGALLAFEELGIKLDIGQCISGGCFALLKTLEGGAKESEACWYEVECKGYHAIFGRRIQALTHIAYGANSLFSDRGLDDLLVMLDIDKLINSPTLIEVVVWNEKLEQLEVVTNHSFRDKPPLEKEKFRLFVKASASLPGFFPPVKIDDCFYSDGCEWVLDSFVDCDTLFIVDSSQPQIIADTSQLTWHKRIMKRFNSLIDRCSEKELKFFAEDYGFKFFPDPESDQSLWDGIKRIARTVAKKFAGQPLTKQIVVIHPTINIQTLMLDYFAKGDIAIAIKHGYDCTKKILQQLFNM